MVSVILNWIYLIITTFIVGYGVLRLLTRHFSYQVQNADACLVCGLVCVTVYAQFFSLFAGVGLLANILLLLVCLLLLWRERTGFADVLSQCLAPWREGGKRELCLRWLPTLALFLLFAYGTSRGMMHYDTGLYHAQSIRWIEEYGAVKGLGNLHSRLAYNSSSFALSALYSMAFLGGGSLHCCAGFLAYLLAVVCLEMGKFLRAGRLCASVFARVMCVYYLVNIFDEMISPASDYFMVLLAFYLVIRWLDLLESGERTILPYGLLCVLGVFLMTVKLSAACILLLTIYPAIRLVREKKWKETGVYLGLGIVTVLPFLIRNVWLSGWLVYPFTQIDLFSVPWKISKGMADYDAREIQVYGRGYTDVAQFQMPMREWMPGWFQTLPVSDRLFILAAAVSVLVLLAYAVGMIFGWWNRRWELLLVQGTVAASFVFWLCTSPLIRYGCVWAYLAPAVVFGGIFDAALHFDDAGEKENKAAQGGRRRLLWVERMASAMVILFLLYKGVALGRIALSCEKGYLLSQKDYENYETRSYEIEGITFYCPMEGDRVGYEAFPSSPQEAKIRFLGDGLADGFVVK